MISRKHVSQIGLFLGPLLFLITLIVPIGTSNSLTFEARIDQRVGLEASGPKVLGSSRLNSSTNPSLLTKPFCISTTIRAGEIVRPVGRVARNI